MNAKFREMILTYALLITILLSSCSVAPDLVEGAGQVLELQPSTSFNGLFSALMGWKNTLVMAGPNGLKLFGWRQPGLGWGFACMNCGCGDPIGLWHWLTGGKANLVTPTDFSGLVTHLQNNGWKIIPPASLPMAVTGTTAQAGAWFTQMAASMTTILVLPVVPLNSPYAPVEVVQ